MAIVRNITLDLLALALDVRRHKRQVLEQINQRRCHQQAIRGIKDSSKWSVYFSGE